MEKVAQALSLKGSLGDKQQGEAWPAVVADVLCVSKHKSHMNAGGERKHKTCTSEGIVRGKYFLAYTVPIFCL